MGFLKNVHAESDFDIWRYQQILCPDYPAFLDDYIQLPIVRRLGGVGLLCGTDWTPLFHNKFFYSRLDHSLGTALIVWNFTRNKKQTLAALLHDVATPAFSHVTDFRNGDALRQESTEQPTAQMINEDVELSELLFRDGIYKYEIDNYHLYPIADNDRPGLSADRLEYMFPSGAALDALWTMESIAQSYGQIAVLRNEHDAPELGFETAEAALEYARTFCAVSRILQHNEDKVAMQLMADVLTRAISCKFISEHDLFALDEEYIIATFDRIAAQHIDEQFTRLFHTFRHMTVVQHTQEPLADSYCVSLAVKKRFVDPLVRTASSGQGTRVSQVSAEAAECIAEFLAFTDTQFGCVPWC